MRLARLLPTSFRGRLILLLLASLLTAQAVSLVLLLDERRLAVRERVAGGLAISARLDDGRWLNIETRLARPPLQFAWPTLVATALGALLVTAVVWLSVQSLARPIRALADGAERVGSGAFDRPLPAGGPDEVRRATEAFNRMQAQLRRLMEERTRMIAAQVMAQRRD